MPTLEIVPVVVANPYCCAASIRSPAVAPELSCACVRINGDFHLGQIDHHAILDSDRPKISCPAPRTEQSRDRVQRIV